MCLHAVLTILAFKIFLVTVGDEQKWQRWALFGAIAIVNVIIIAISLIYFLFFIWFALKFNDDDDDTKQYQSRSRKFDNSDVEFEIRYLRRTVKFNISNCRIVFAGKSYLGVIKLSVSFRNVTATLLFIF